MFWGWNVLMALSLVAGLGKNADRYANLGSDAARQGHEIGTALGLITILVMWAMGAVILGLLVYFTRGRRELIEVDT